MDNIILNESNLRVDIIVEEDGLHVDTHVVGIDVDRTRLIGFGVKRRDHKLAFRLKRAILAGKVFGPGVIRRDINDHTYLHADSNIYGRRMNADLKRMGF